LTRFFIVILRDQRRLLKKRSDWLQRHFVQDPNKRDYTFNDVKEKRF